MLEKSQHTQARSLGLTATFIVLVFLLGGGARADISSLVVLRPIAALIFFYGAYLLTREQLVRYRFIFGFAGACLLLGILHLIPLPPMIWSSLPGRDLIEQIDKAAALGSVWRPLSMVPQDGWNAVFSLVVPFAALMMAIHCERDEFWIPLLFVALGFASIMVGLLQLQGGSGSPFYFYRITNAGQMVGLFANRNHFAIYLSVLIPIIAYLVSLPTRDQNSMRMKFAFAAMGFLGILGAIVIIGSRAGFLFSVLASISALMLLRMPKTRARRHSDTAAPLPDILMRHARWIGIALTGIIAVGMFAFSRSETMQRVLQTDQAEELRFKVLGPILQMGWKYFPVGSGLGSFVETYKIDEPIALLEPHYLNHANDDLLEIWLTLGVPGLLLVLVALLAWGRGALKLFKNNNSRPSILRARLGALIIALLALASLLDYPLRTPSLASIFAIASIWMIQGVKGAAAEFRKPSNV